jgi:hypothetical protein
VPSCAQAARRDHKKAPFLKQSLFVRDEDGEIYTVRYEAVNALLLNEFLNVHL